MTIPRKPDRQAILDHLSRLKLEPWLRTTRSWWPDFLFRVDDIVAAANILNTGRLLSRAQAIREGLLTDDAASPIVIGNTSNTWKEHVRLYFRPRTPTQYRFEGFRPRDACTLGGAHCPVPVVMLFEAKDILTRATTKFSDGNLAAASPQVGEDVEFLTGIPFEKVYHSDPLIDESTKANILYHRHAEVIIPKELDLSALRFIACRSQAEYETLLHMLDREARKKWSGIITLGNTRYLHHRKWTFIEQVDLTDDLITVRFNPSTCAPGPFTIRVTVKDLDKRKYVWEQTDYKAVGDQKIRLTLQHQKEYWVVIKLDDRVAYANYYRKMERPL